MSEQFDQFKETLEKFYPEYKSWVEENGANFPPDKIGNGAFTMQEASDLLLEFCESMNIVLEDQEQSLKHVTTSEVSVMHACLSGMLATAKKGLSTGNYTDFTNKIDDLIPYIRIVKFLSMEWIDKNNKKMRELARSHDNAHQYTQQIKDVLNSANEHKATIDSFVDLIQKREEKITSQNVATEAYEEKLRDFSDEQIAKLKYFSAEHQSRIVQADILIQKSHKALNLSTANALSGAFQTRQEKLEDKKVKKTWLIAGGTAVACAIIIGIYTLFDKDITIANVAARTFLMTILIGVAVFCSKQYAKNRSFEEDYAYKVALAASLPGIAEECEKAELRKEYVGKLLDEILQDPQRARHDKESLVDSHPLMAGLKKFMKKNET